MAQDDYWYEIHLSNKQLVFYFMAAATGLILSFLAGVMVGRGVDASPEASAAGRVPRQEEKVVAEEPVRPAPPSPQDMTYAQRLESERTDESLDKPGQERMQDARAGVSGIRPQPSPAAAAATPAPAKPTPAATPAPAKPTPAATARPSAAPPAPPRTQPAPGGAFAIQVGAFKDRAGADAMMGRLKGKGLPAYVVPGGEGLYTVRVGSYATRAEAEQVQVRLRDQESLKPFIVKN